ncbi:MAG: sulfatase-like hydrolase/transferase [Planctomycetota bacterium]
MAPRPPRSSGLGPSRRDFLGRAVCGAAGASLAANLLGCTRKEPSRPPNLVLIVADDLGYEGLGSYGGVSYETPNLDALAAGGLRFDHCFATPLCTQSRVQLLTGRYPFRTGWNDFIEKRPWGQRFLDPAKERTFAHVLRDADYATAVAGKWQMCYFATHPDHASACGFDRSYLWSFMVDGKESNRYWNPSVVVDGAPPLTVENHYGPRLYCNFLLEFMEQHKEEPFLAYFPMTLPHGPYLPTPGSSTPDERDRGWRWENNPANFPDMVSFLDRLVGRVAATLDRLGIRDRTLILFCSDNGTPGDFTSRLRNGRAIRGGKGRMTEAGTRIPLIASMPGTVPAGGVCHDLVDLSDFLPTLAAFGGAPLPEGVTLDGRSFAPQLRGEKGRPREWVFCQAGEKRFLRGPRFKLHNDGRFYDVEADPGEKTDLAAGGSLAPEARAARDRLAGILAGFP